MMFYGCYNYLPQHREEVHRRFRETGAPPPEGVRMIGRWHGAEGNDGLFIAESEDAAALAAWLQDWTDLLSFDLRPVLTDEEFSAVIGG
jgi:hypothetical protein